MRKDSPEAEACAVFAVGETPFLSPPRRGGGSKRAALEQTPKDKQNPTQQWERATSAPNPSKADAPHEPKRHFNNNRNAADLTMTACHCTCRSRSGANYPPEIFPDSRNPIEVRNADVSTSAQDRRPLLKIAPPLGSDTLGRLD